MMKKIFAKEIIDYLKSQEIRVEVKGNEEAWIDGCSSLNMLTEKKISWVKYWTEEAAKKLEGKKENIIVGRFLDAAEPKDGNCHILCEEPKMCFFMILNNFFVEESTRKVSETAAVRTTKIGGGCSIGEFSVLGEEVIIGNNVTIGNHVILQGKVTVGNYCVIESGTVIGKSGFGFYQNQAGHLERVPHLGGVIIGDYVEIGANTCIDCGTMDDTIIGDYCKIDNLCNIGHNVRLGQDVTVIQGTEICGSCVIGDGCYLSPGTVIKNQTHIGENCFIGMQTVVIKDVAPDSSVFGVPARPFKRSYVV